ncbi:MAG: hypothetical protein KAS32_24305 [Candidatus Peribacteraceae bacterium]|nr:hypothetical protein [Candidatus Peribacteraceae bacterium]
MVIKLSEKQKSALKVAYNALYSEYKKETRKRKPSAYQIAQHKLHLREMQGILNGLWPEGEQLSFTRL